MAIATAQDEPVANKHQTKQAIPQQIKTKTGPKQAQSLGLAQARALDLLHLTMEVATSSHMSPRLQSQVSGILKKARE
jgi:hypothetical protein